MTRIAVLAAGLWLAGAAAAQPPGLPPGFPAPPPPPSPLDGRWFFRGDPNQPCTVKSIWTPAGPMIVVVNEKGTPAAAQFSRFGVRLTVPEWGIVGTVRANAIVWPNGDFWAR
jgi:hypothetical protein